MMESINHRQSSNSSNWLRFFQTICFLFLCGNVAMDNILNDSLFKSLNQVIVLHKHGELVHTSILPNLYTSDNSSQNGHLTPKGRLMMYELGKALRSRYGSFLSENPLEYEAESSEDDVTLESSLLVLHGLVKAEGRWVYENGTDFLPIPIHTSPKEYPCALDSNCGCPYIEQWIKSLENHPSMRNLKSTYMDTINYLVQQTNSTQFDSLINCTILFKDLEYARNNGFPLPAYITPHIYKNLSKIDVQVEQLEACSSDILPIKITGFLKQLENIISENLSPVNLTLAINKPKFHLFSSSDHVLSSVLCGLGVSSSKIVPEGAALMIEMYEIDDQDYIRLAYWDTDYIIEPSDLVPTYCNQTTELCETKEFLKNLDSFILPNWEEKCGYCLNGYRAGEIMAIILCVIILTIILTTCAAVVRRRRNREDYELIE